MITNTLMQLVTQTGFRKPLEGRHREIANAACRIVHDVINPSAEDKMQRTRLAIYFVASYLAMC